MIINIRHIGLVVNNLSLMKNFYMKLGFNEHISGIEKGKFIDNVTGLENVNLEWIKLKSRDGQLLELLKYHSHPDNGQLEIRKSNKHGCSHVAFTVEDSDEFCKLIVKHGGSIINQPMLSPDKKVKVSYCHDPEGILMEIVQIL